MRLFAALSPPDEARDRLIAAQSGLPDGRLVSRENLHLTLGFFGEVDGPTAEDLHAALAAIAAPGFDLWLDGAGAFGGSGADGGGKMRALYMAARPDPALNRLHEKVAQAARAAGVAMEAKRFTPHVTLTRLRPGRSDPRRVAEWLSAAGAFLSGPHAVASFGLFRSTLGRRGPTYEEMARYELAPRA